NTFSPACDAILDAQSFRQFPNLLRYAKTSVNIIRWSFFLSLLYNVVGISLAVTGRLSPLLSAILMPLSSISVVLFTTLTTNFRARKIGLALRTAEK
ncbi:MAG: heavy metal translocating P-type ATPase, partial [FCB group bacterium]|nr:heavy metal translocating P-type ATPase [FCB group bacterium]